MKEEKELEYRLYGFVPYNLSPIQQGIQFGHAAIEYSIKYQDELAYKKWANFDKTFIILSGGTTSLSEKTPGSLNQIVKHLTAEHVNHACFHEPDLGDQLTAIVFLVGEEIYDYETYPDESLQSHMLEFRNWLRSYRLA